MKQSIQNILTTHTGSLPRQTDLRQMLEAQDRGERVESNIFETRVRDAANAIVQQQVSCGIDVVNDGEMSKISYSTYAKDRLTGFGGQSKRKITPLADLVDFPEFAQQHMLISPWSKYAMPACNGPISYRGNAALERDCVNLKVALQGTNATEAFMTAASPGVIARFLENQYYPTHEAYLYALADAMKVEYDTIHQAGFILQLDCPDLTRCDQTQNTQKGTGYLALHIEALNHAVRDIPPERMRLHVCWGNYEGP
ncbi:MAG: epoxyalkane--coenzyme M transferase, partial [Chloroflexi bacterium]|nr:epoxyalkane--coenzyme M transferase [Chloroflexota bacterium]